MALPVMTPFNLPPSFSRIFLKTIASAILNFRLVLKHDLPCAASSRFFLPLSTPMTNNVLASPPSSFIFVHNPSYTLLKTLGTAVMNVGLTRAKSAPIVAALSARPMDAPSRQYTASSPSPKTCAQGRMDNALSFSFSSGTVSYTHLRAHETVLDLVCRL